MEKLDRGGAQEPLLTGGPLVESLKRGRERYNARFAYARRLNRRLKPDDFARVLSGLLDPIIRAVAGIDASHVDRVTEVLYDLALELMGQDCLGGQTRYPLINLAWQRLLPAAAGLVAAEPRRLAAAVSNAVYHLSNESEDQGAAWIEIMLDLLRKQPDLATFLAAGQVAAWRCGLAHLRAGALTVWAGLPDDIKYEVLGLTDPASRPSPLELRQALTDPWLAPKDAGRPVARKPVLTARTGGFRGFGGPFIQPPQVKAVDGILFAFDPEACFSIFADCYGVLLKRAPDQIRTEKGQDSRVFTLSEAGLVSGPGGKSSLPILKAYSSKAATTDTLAVTLPHSHFIYLVASVAVDN